MRNSISSHWGFELLPHSSYSPNLAPSDFFLFPLLKSHKSVHYFGNNEVICALGRNQDAIFFRYEIAMPEYHVTNYIDVKYWKLSSFSDSFWTTLVC